MSVLKTNSERLLEMEPLAIAAAREMVEVEIAKLSDWEKQHVFLVGNLGEEWAVFDWCVPARTERVVRFLTRAAINRRTNEVVLEPNPQQAIMPDRKGLLIAGTLVFPIVIAACFALAEGCFDFMKSGHWPPMARMGLYFLILWPIWQIGALLIVRQTLLTSAPIRLPDGTVTRVDRIWLKNVSTHPAANGTSD